jgi:hypothetical protein
MTSSLVVLTALLALSLLLATRFREPEGLARPQSAAGRR